MRYMLVFVKIGKCAQGYLLLSGGSKVGPLGSGVCWIRSSKTVLKSLTRGYQRGSSNALPIPEQITLVTNAGVPGSTVRRPHGHKLYMAGDAHPCSPPARDWS